MKILFFTIGTDIVASSRTRAYQFVPYLERKGISCRVISLCSARKCRDDILLKRLNVQIKIFDKILSWFKIAKVLFLLKDYDAIFIQRLLLPKFIEKVIRKYKKKVIFDFDDPLQQLKGKFFSRFIGLLQISDLVLVENDFNKNFVLNYNRNVTIITGPIDIQRYAPRPGPGNNNKVVIGWIGTFSSAKYLSIIRGALGNLKDRFKEEITIKIISAKELAWDDIPHEFVEWRLDTEVRELQDFDIGIMPLEDDEWCCGRGGYKLLQYMAIGIPCVASPIGINRKMIEEGVNGFLADSQKEWIEKIDLLIKNADLRLKMGQAGRKMAEQLYSYEVAAPKLIEALKNL